MPTEEALLENLNPQQAEAVSHHGSPLLIVAGAGSGKTRVITHRIAYLHRAIGIPLWQILAVTFTNKAAREMRTRICRLLGIPDDPSLAISTFHSRCAAILRRESDSAGLESNFTILDERDQRAAVQKAMEAAGVSDKVVRPAQAQNFINLAKMKMLTPEDCEEEFANDQVPYVPVYAAYEEILLKNACLDFEDLIFKTVRLFEHHADVLERWNRKYKYLLVDEFQDTNMSQFELVKQLAGPERNICVVGDEDQSIYSWRGADVRNLLEFQEVYKDARLIRLEQNYRSVGRVLKAAGSVIEKNTMRIGKTLWTEREEGEKFTALVGADDVEEADLVARQISNLLIAEGRPAAEVAVFYRTHSLARPFEDALRRYRVPYRIIGGTRFYDRAEIKDLLAFLQLAARPSNDLAFERVVNIPARGVGKKTLNEMIQRGMRDGTSTYKAALTIQEEGGFKGKARKGMEEFLAAVGQWHNMAKSDGVAGILARVIEDTRYKTEGVGDPESLDGRSRLENIEELETVAQEFEMEESQHGVDAFLESLSLDQNREDRDERPKISLMTVHNAKGLEFDDVFVVGLEQGAFPNSRTFDHPDQFEEERRLFYVALTRARERVYLCRAHRRRRQGFYEPTIPSQFLSELSPEVLDQTDRRRLGVETRTAGPLGHDPATGYQRAFGRQNAGPPSGPAGKRASLQVGDRVEHRVLGTGIVSEQGGRRGSERVMVEFDDGRSQEFLVRFAPLKKIE